MRVMTVGTTAAKLNTTQVLSMGIVDLWEPAHRIRGEELENVVRHARTEVITVRQDKLEQRASRWGKTNWNRHHHVEKNMLEKKA